MASFTKNILRKQGRPGRTPEGRIFVVAEDLDADWPWAQIRVFLYNYNIDGNLPKEEHKHWVRTQLRTFLMKTRYHAELQGLASASGDARYNEQLSLERVLLLKEFLIDECGLSESQVPGTRMSAVGERFANPHDDEDAHDRAVKITIKPHRLTKPIPLPRKKQPPPAPPFGDIPWIPPKLPPLPHPGDPPEYNDFRIRYCGGGGLSSPLKGLGATSHVFEIENAVTGRRAKFVLSGVSVSAGVGLPVTLPGNEWTHLTTDEGLDLEDFNGEHVAYYGQAVGSLSWSELAFDHLHDASSPRSRAKASVATGATLGVEMSNTRGTLQMLPP